MKNNGSRTSKNKELNSTRLSVVSSDNETESKLKALEAAISILTNQNETLTNRIDILEERQSKILTSSNSGKSISNINNTLIDAEKGEEIYNIQRIEAKNSNDQNSIFINDLFEWKKDIEKSIKTISEKVASINYSVSIDLLDKKISESNKELSKLNKKFHDSLDNSAVIKKNLEKFEKTEKLISSMLQGMSDMKSNNVKWQTDFLRNLNDFNEKIILQESTLEELEKFEIIFNKKIDSINYDIRNIQIEMNNKTYEMEIKSTTSISTLGKLLEKLEEQNKNLNLKLTEEINKAESK